MIRVRPSGGLAPQVQAAGTASTRDELLPSAAMKPPESLRLGPVLVAAIVFVVTGVLTHFGVLAPSHRSGAEATRNRLEPRGQESAAWSRVGQAGGEGVGEASVPPGEPGAGEAEVEEALLRRVAQSLERVRTLTDPEEQDRALQGFVEATRVSDIPRAIDVVREQGSTGPSRELALRLLRRWAAADPAAAASWLRGTAGGPIRVEAVGTLSAWWAAEDLPAAARWVREWPAGAEREAGLRAAAYEVAGDRPLEALQLAAELPPDTGRDRLVTHIVRQWATIEPARAAEWAQQIAPGTFRDRVLSDLATSWGDTDPESAAAFAVSALPEGRAQADAVIGIVQRWAQTAPASAASWVMEFPAGPVLEGALENLVRLWAEQDPEQAGEWLNGMPQGVWRDVAVTAYVGAVASRFPAAAGEWSAAIVDDALRARSVERVGEVWDVRDATAAAAWRQVMARPGVTPSR